MKKEPIRIIRSRRKTLALEVTPNATLLVRAPFWLPSWQIKRFIRDRSTWIKKKQDYQLKKQINLIPKRYINGEEFLYLSEKYKLEIIEDQAEPLILEGKFKLSSNFRKKASEVFIDWYKQEAIHTIKERLEYYSSVFSLRYKSFRISNAKKRWGSCSADGRLNFSWRLIMAPLPVIDYVVAHELVHLSEHNHSKRFWQKVSNIMPDYKRQRKWLKDNGNNLTIE